LRNLLSISALLAVSAVQPVLADEWTGIYGTATAGLSRVEVLGEQGTDDAIDNDLGALAGLGLGGNLQYGNFVLGLEADISATGNQTQLAMKDTVNADQDWFATARARAGLHADGTLIYATGGLAMLGVEVANANGSDRDQMNGWTIGGGLERQISERIRFKAEGLYLNFGKEILDLDTSTDTIPNPSIQLDTTMAIARVGLTYDF
jgi:outer membrane immunogenic protein